MKPFATYAALYTWARQFANGPVSVLLGNPLTPQQFTLLGATKPNR